MELVFVTGNAKKIKEVSALLSDSVTLIQQNIEIEEIQSNSLEKISADKVQKAFSYIQAPVIVEDSGVYFDAYKDFPGPFAKFAFPSLGFEGFRRLIEPADIKTGKMVAVLSYLAPGMEIPLQFIGEALGSFDFSFLNLESDPFVPYNNIFIPKGYQVPVFKMYDEWCTFNHRTQAINQFKNFLSQS